MLEADIQLRLGSFDLSARFAVPGDGITALFGPSGSGKSTLLSALCGLRQPARAHITLDGRRIDDRPPHRRGIGVVFQDARLFPHLTVRQNISYARVRAPQERRPDIAAVAEFFDIAAQLDRPVTNLSGGEKSRVALARAIAAAPDFLLLDEPFAALDGARRRAFIQVLTDMHRNYRLPMMVVTHNIDDAAALAAHMIALKAGRVVAAGALCDVAHMRVFQELLDVRDIGAAIPASAMRSSYGGQSLWLRADQVLLATEEPKRVSARNVLPGRISEMTQEEEGGQRITVTTQAGPILSRLTCEAVLDLDLQVGRAVWVLAKAHAF